MYINRVIGGTVNVYVGGEWHVGGRGTLVGGAHQNIVDKENRGGNTLVV